MFPPKEMPRYTISNNKKYYDKLWDLLQNGTNDSLKEEVWDLVCMLATNQKEYEDIVS